MKKNIVIGFMVLGILVFSIGCSPGKVKGQAPAKERTKEKSDFLLAGDIAWRIDKIRTWKSFDSKFPPEESVRHWISGSNSMGCKAFAPYEGTEPVKASGRFWELLVRFENKGKVQKTQWFHKKDQKGLDFQFIVPRNNIPLRAFLIPGLNIAPISLAVSWEGKLGIKLDPGQKTWLLLLFDVPTNYDSAHFKLKDTSPVPVILPKQGKQ